MNHSATKNEWKRMKTLFLFLVFICYLLFMVKILFLSRLSPVEAADSGEAVSRSINLVPFHTIGEYLSSSSQDVQKVAFSHVVGNIILFVPVGLFLPLLRKNKRIASNLLLIFLVSFVSESIQGVLNLGTPDIDDILLNSLGGLVGMLGYKTLVWLLRNEKNAQTAVVILSAVIGLPVLFYLSFFVHLHL